MFGKKLFSIFGMLVAGAIGVTTLGVTTSLIGVGLAQGNVDANGTHHETFTQIVKNAESKDSIKTSEGTYLEVLTTQNKPLDLTSGLAHLNTGDTFELVDPVGSIKHVEITFTVAGKDYVKVDNDVAPVIMEEGYMLDTTSENPEVYYVPTDAGFRTEYNFVNNYPSYLKFTAKSDDIHIKEMKLEYLCKIHVDSEALSDQNAYYMVGVINGKNAPVTTKGIKMTYTSSQYEYKLSLKKGDVIQFKKPRKEISKIALQNGGAYSAVLEGFVAMEGENNDTKLSILEDGVYAFYYKPDDGNQLFVTCEPKQVRNWYLVGDELNFNGKAYNNVWSCNEELKLNAVDGEEFVFEIQNVTIKAGKGFKLLTKSGKYLSNISQESKSIAKAEGEGNIFVHNDGVYNIKVDVKDNPYIIITKAN